MNPVLNIAAAYDGSTPLYRLLRALGWGPLLNLGYVSPLQPRTLWSLPHAQENLVRNAVKLLHVRKGDTVVDVGCGRGRSTTFITEHTEASMTWGIDLDYTHIDAARAWYGESPRRRYRVGDACELPFNKGTVQRLLCLEAAFHFDRARFLLEVSRVLHGFGRAVIVDFMWPNDAARSSTPGWCRAACQRTWQYADFSTIDEYRSMIEGAKLAVIHELDWTKRVSRAIQRRFGWLLLCASTAPGRSFLQWRFPGLRDFSDGDWRELWRQHDAHLELSRVVRYRAVVVRRRYLRKAERQLK